MTAGELEAIVRDGYDTRLTNDVDKVHALFHDDARIRIAGGPAETAMVTGLADGGARRSIEAMVGTWHWLEVRDLEVIVSGNRAASHYVAQIRFNVTGEIIETRLADFATWRDGKIADFLEFCDTALIGRLMATAGVK